VLPNKSLSATPRVGGGAALHSVSANDRFRPFQAILDIHYIRGAATSAAPLLVPQTHSSSSVPAPVFEIGM